MITILTLFLLSTSALVVLFIKACNGNRKYVTNCSVSLHYTFILISYWYLYILFDFLYREAFNIVVLFWLFCGVLLLLLTQTVVKDEASVQASVRDALAAAALDPQNMAETTENPLGIRLLDAPAPPVSSAEESSSGNKGARRSMQGGYESI